jgi:hypothetical protein
MVVLSVPTKSLRYHNSHCFWGGHFISLYQRKKEYLQTHGRWGGVPTRCQFWGKLAEEEDEMSNSCPAASGKDLCDIQSLVGAMVDHVGQQMSLDGKMKVLKQPQGHMRRKTGKKVNVYSSGRHRNYYLGTLE